MKVIYLFIYLSIFSLCVTSLSCKKLDFEKNDKVLNSQNITEKFFNEHRTSNPTEAALVNYIKEKNVKENIVEKWVKQFGFPRWDKIGNQKINSYESRGSNVTGETVTNFHIPFVIESQNIVNASLIISTSSSDTSLVFKQNWEYKNKQNTVQNYKDDAEKYALYFMIMDQFVFEYSKFKILDTNLFRVNNRVAKYVVLKPITENDFSTNLFELNLVCTDASISWQNCPYPVGHCSGPNGACDNCDKCTNSISWTHCVGGLSSGAPVDVPTPTAGTTYPGGSPLGWEPVINDIILLGNHDPTTDSIPNKLSTLVSSKLDSLYQWGMINGFREQVFIIVEKNGVKYPKNFRPVTLGGKTAPPSYFLEPREQLLAYCHTHAEDTVHDWRTSFSPDDLIEFDKNARQIGYTALLEVGNARYAFVLEDVGKHNNFNISKKGRHVQYFTEIWNSLNISNGQTLSEQTMIQYLGSASISGVGFYKSTRVNGKNIFTKLNP